MQQIINKYLLEDLTRQEVRMPKGAKILSARCVSGKTYMWTIESIADPIVNRVIRIIKTGTVLTDETNLEYITSVDVGPWLWHIFEEKV